MIEQLWSAPGIQPGSTIPAEDYTTLKQINKTKTKSTPSKRKDKRGAYQLSLEILTFQHCQHPSKIKEFVIFFQLIVFINSNSQ